MRIGICTTDFRQMPAGALFEKIARMGYASTQFSFASITESGYTEGASIEIPPAISRDVIDCIRAASTEHGIPIVAINGTFNMAHPDAAVREEGIRRFEVLADAAVQLGVPMLTLCTGTRNTSSLWAPHADNLSDGAWRDCMDTARALAAIAEARNLVLAVETEAANVIQTAEKARRMMDEVGSPALKMILDGANLFLPGTARVQNVRATLERAFEMFGRDIVLAHGKDIRAGDGIDFCGTGLGILDFDLFVELLREVGYRGDFVLHGIYDEGDMPRALEFIRGKLKK